MVLSKRDPPPVRPENFIDKIAVPLYRSTIIRHLYLTIRDTSYPELISSNNQPKLGGHQIRFSQTERESN